MHVQVWLKHCAVHQTLATLQTDCIPIKTNKQTKKHSFFPSAPKALTQNIQSQFGGSAQALVSSYVSLSPTPFSLLRNRTPVPRFLPLPPSRAGSCPPSLCSALGAISPGGPSGISRLSPRRGRTMATTRPPAGELGPDLTCSQLLKHPASGLCLPVLPWNKAKLYKAGIK